MASASTKAATTKSTLKPVTTLKGHGNRIGSKSYFPDGQRMISGSDDTTTRQWILKAGKENEEARGVCEGSVYAVTVSRNGRWVATGGGDGGRGELKVREVETGIVKTFKGHSSLITCIDISADSRLLASGSWDATARVWNLNTSKLIAGPFKSEDETGSVRFSTDSKKLAVKSNTGQCLEVWDVQSQKLDINVGKCGRSGYNEDDNITTIYEFDGSTLKTIGTPFVGHTKLITGLALSFGHALLVSASYDNTIKLWAVESRQLLASFDIQNLLRLVLSPNSRQLAYTSFIEGNYKICICDTPPDVLAQAHTSAHKKAPLRDLLDSDATRRPLAGRRKPPISDTSMALRPLPTVKPQQPMLLRLGNFLRFSPSPSAVHPVRNDQPNPLDVPATSPLPSPLSGQAAVQFDHFEISSSPPRSNRVVQSLWQHLSFLVPRHSHGPPVVEVAPGRKVARLVAVKLLDTRLANRLPHHRKMTHLTSIRSRTLRLPPRWRLERVDIPRQDGATNGSRSGACGRS